VVKMAGILPIMGGRAFLQRIKIDEIVVPQLAQPGILVPIGVKFTVNCPRGSAKFKVKISDKLPDGSIITLKEIDAERKNGTYTGAIPVELPKVSGIDTIIVEFYCMGIFGFIPRLQDRAEADLEKRA